MSLRSLRWTFPPLALFALVGWFASSPGRPAEAGADADADADSPQRAAIIAAQGPAALPPSVAGPDRLAAVAKFVAQKNAEGSRDQESFARAGWQMVDAPPPERKLLALDPSLLASREADLRQQIASNTPSPDQAENLARVAREAREEATQVAAVESLGRIAGDEGQDQLLGLLRELPAES